ncbi:hypothetical protein [Streptomyces sp. Amel2xE9]|uniref:hypothetical protein n=1 Tax=Streptomyces sp. Amel2xE9 TaxID=1157634 RepID=UPI003B63A110
MQTTYRGLVEPAMAQPVHETATSWLTACRSVPQPGYPHTPMLASSLVVPKDHTAPFGLPNSDPWNWLARWDDGEMPARPIFRRLRCPATPRGSGRRRRNSARSCPSRTTPTGRRPWRRSPNCPSAPGRWSGSAARTAGVAKPWGCW